MIPKDCKRLAEVDFPIAEVSRHAAREKSIRHGHPSTLHLWWARRPLASSRAVLLALLWPDPCDPHCPQLFKTQARKLLPQVGGCNPGVTDEELRAALLKFIAAFANWDNAAQPTYLDVSRALIVAAYGREAPLVVDPFAGGGSIPLEALRLGCEAFASDLNPVACLILKVMLEDIPRHGPTLADEVRTVGAEVNRLAKQELAALYPNDPDGASPLVYFWARTVHCESPNCGAEIPLVRSFWLSTADKHQRAIRYKMVESRKGKWSLDLEVFAPRAVKEVQKGTVAQAKATCPRCGGVMPKDRLRAQLCEQDGGSDVRLGADGSRVGGALLLAKLVRRVDGSREYRPAMRRDYQALALARTKVQPDSIPTERIEQERVAKNSPFRVHLYGMRRFADIFTVRQVAALQVYSNSIGTIVPGSLAGLFACVSSRCADYWSSCAVWAKGGEFVAHTFGRQALSIVWDFAETVPIGDGSGNFAGAVEWVALVAEALSVVRVVGQVEQLDAAQSSLPSESADVWFTDPPYYDAVSYADLSDYFFVWLKRQKYLEGLLRDPFDAGNALTPKAQEAIQDEFKVYGGVAKTGNFYETKMKEAFREGSRITRPDGVGCVVFAHKTTEGWEALLSGMIAGGWTVTGSWPIATERPGRLRSQDSAALATSVHLICRRRDESASVGDWGDVLHELPVRVGSWMERLQGEGVRGADLVFACIGPALEIFSRYVRVETADGRDVELPEYLRKVWEVVGRSALAQVLGTAEATARNGSAGAIEEDARLTALFLWTLQSTGGQTEDDAADAGEDEESSSEDDAETGSSQGKAKGFTLIYDVVRRFAQPLGIDLPKWEGRIIEKRKGVVRLIPIAERAKQLFGVDGAQAVASRLEQGEMTTNPLQGMLFPDLDAGEQVRGRDQARGKRGGAEVSDESLAAPRQATTLDRVHAAMLFQAGGRTNALRALLKAEQERGPDFLRLANSLSALYPKGSEEKRLMDAMLLAVPR
jgi:putative DNA methylase